MKNEKVLLVKKDIFHGKNLLQFNSNTLSKWAILLLKAYIISADYTILFISPPQKLLILSDFIKAKNLNGRKYKCVFYLSLHIQ